MDRRILGLLQPVRPLLIGVAVSGLAGTIALLLQMKLLAGAVTGVFLQGRTLQEESGVLFTMLVLLTVRGGLSWVGEVYALRLAIHIKSDVRQRLMHHVFALGSAFVKGERTGELLNTVYEGIEQLEVYFARYIPQLAFVALIPTALWVFLVTQDWLSGVILLVTAPLIPLFMILIGKSAQALTERQWQTLSLLSAHFHDILHGLVTLKLFNRSHSQVQTIARVGEEYRKATMGTLRVAFLSAFVLELFTTLSTAIVAVSLALRLMSGGIGFTPALTVLLLTPEFYLPFRALGTQFHAGLNGVIAANRIFAILAAKPAGLREEPAASTLAEREFTISFADVSFAYPGSDEARLDHVSFVARPNEPLAVIGPSGAGKSTMLDLLMGFIRPDAGLIRVNDLPLAELSIRWWRDQVSFVSQSPHLFDATILDNLRIAKPSATLEEISDAAMRAQIHHAIVRLPNGYDTSIGKGGQGLSGGQRQRMAIARAFLKESPVIILDEPTSFLDVETEQVLQAALDELFVGRTAIVVAHRMSTVLRAQNVLVLDNGRVAQVGSHAQLQRENGLYRDLLAAYGGDA